ncbi:hypothetical protein [Mycoplana rhizolycopersici]|uniref:Uncharacterized protein n=1 Tax=Mycoplana rhizolycopersici TaxID=2746702 RepID=A0ABX2QBU8_9HYPH|nr:hypothetical protein [Rhizobium rhizolycopersici]NVP54439.1 hypothetical protein [Rhizobium rhizolycopersici]
MASTGNDLVNIERQRMHVLPKGKTFRLDGDLTVKKGDHFYGVECNECGKWIALFPDNSKGRTPVTISGEGLISTPCACGYDGDYSAEQMKPFKANFTRTSFREQRVKASGGERKPFLPSYKGAKVTLGPEMLERRPAAAQIVARSIAAWTYLEIATAEILALLLKADTDAAAAVYLSLQNARARQDVLKAAANSTLSNDDLLLLNALLAIKSGLEKSRNALAHGVFGICVKIPDGIVWCETTDFIKFGRENAVNGLTESARQTFHKRMYVYQLADLETIAQGIADLENQFKFFSGYLRSTSSESKLSRYVELCSHPKVAREIAKMKAGSENQ